MEIPIVEKVDPKLVSEVFNLVAELQPHKVDITETLNTLEHYTFVCFLPKEIDQKAKTIINDLKNLEPTLLTNTAGLVHLTLFHCPIETNLEPIIIKIKEAIDQKKLSFHLFGLLVTNSGIGIAAFPTNNNLRALRRDLYKIIGEELPNNYRGLMTWATLARFSQHPNSQLFDYLDQKMTKDYGYINPEEVSVYKSRDKNLLTGELITKIS